MCKKEQNDVLRQWSLIFWLQTRPHKECSVQIHAQKYTLRSELSTPQVRVKLPSIEQSTERKYGAIALSEHTCSKGANIKLKL